MSKFERETDTDIFAEAQERIVQIPMLEETYQDILRLCRENGWEEEEGLRTVLAYGLGYLQGERELVRLNADGADLAAELQAKVEELSGYQSMYAVMKFKAFRLLQVARTLEMNVTGLRGELGLSKATIPRLRQQIEELKAENAHLRERLTGLSPADEPSGGSPVAAVVQQPLASASLSRITRRLQRIWK